MMESSSTFTIVVRSAEERTRDLCVRLIQQQIQPEHTSSVHIVAEKPFAKAHERSIEIALEAQAEWSIFIDADVLLRAGAIVSILDQLKQCAGVPFYMMNFQVLDRGFAGTSYQGVHGYRTQLFSKAQQFSDLAHTDQRPETRLCKEMAKLGYPTVLSKTVVGLHDYEQFYRDLYRKMYVRGIKYNKRADFMYRTLEARYKTHNDYKVMIWGLVHGLLAYGAGERYAPLDSTYYEEKSAAVLDMLSLEEKPLLPADAAAIKIEGIIDASGPDDLYLANRHWIVPDVTLNYFGYNKDKLGRRAMNRAKRLLQIK
jgi:hypothetical protein